MATAAAGYAAAAVVGRTPPHLLESVSYRASSVAGSPPREPAAPEGNGPLVLPPGWAEERKGVRPAASMPGVRRGGGCDACPETQGIGGRRRGYPQPPVMRGGRVGAADGGGARPRVGSGREKGVSDG